MLSHEWCEKLAEKYPAVATHQFKTGDLFYPSDRYQEDFECGPNDGPFPVWMQKHDGSYVAEACPGQGSVWCPRLDQLLELAAEVGDPTLGRWLSFIQGAAYGFTAAIRYSGGRTVGQEMRGGTPEEAVANWLLLAAAAAEQMNAQQQLR